MWRARFIEVRWQSGKPTSQRRLVLRFPKFALTLRHTQCELRKQRSTSNPMISSAALNLKFLKRALRQNCCRNFKFAALVGCFLKFEIRSMVLAPTLILRSAPLARVSKDGYLPGPWPAGPSFETAAQERGGPPQDEVC